MAWCMRSRRNGCVIKETGEMIAFQDDREDGSRQGVPSVPP